MKKALAQSLNCHMFVDRETIRTMATYRLRCFGNLKLDGAPATPQRRSLIVLAILAASGGEVSRDRVISLLWPESDSSSARTALRQALYALRREIHGDVIHAEANILILNSDLLHSDVQQFADARRQKDHATVIDLFRGEFLDDVFGRGSPALDEWIANQRREFAIARESSLESLATNAFRAGDFPGAVGYWQRLAGHDPLSVRAVRGLMESFASMGELATALTHYRSYANLIKKELGSSPDPSLESFAASLKTGNGAAIRATGDSQKPTPKSAAALGEIVHVEKQSRRNQAAVIALLVVLAIVGATGAIVMSTMGGTPSELRLVAIPPFENRTGNTDFDNLGTIAADWMIDGLSNSGIASAVDPATALFALRDARKEHAGSPSDPRFTRAISKSTAASVVITGEYYLRGGDSLEFHARVSDALSDRVIGTMEPVVVASAAQTDAIQKVRQRLLGLVARHFDVRISEVVDRSSKTPSFEAYGEYAKGFESFMRRDYGDAAQKFERAFQLDSSFGTALIWASHAHSNTGDREAAKSVLDRLVPHRRELNPLDRYALDALRQEYADRVDSSLVLAKLAARIAPRSQWVWMVAWYSMMLGEYDQGIRYLESVDPTRGWWADWYPYWLGLARLKHLTHDYEGEAEVIARGIKQHPGNKELSQLTKARSLIGNGKPHEALVLADSMIVADSPQMARWISWTIFEFLQHGYPTHADSLVAKAHVWYAAKGHSTAENRFRWAGILYRAQRWRELKQHMATLSPRWAQDVEVYGYGGSAAAMLGDSVTALAMSDSLSRVDEGRPVALAWRAQILARLGHRQEVVELIRQVKPTGWLGRTWLGHDQRDTYPSMRGYAPFEALVKPR